MKTKLGLFGTLALAAVGFTARPAAAQDLSSCGNIHVEAESKCVVEVEGGCTAKCEPVRFQAACAAELSVECQGMCTAEAQASCTGSCDVSACEARCEADPGNFECSAECSANADAHCAGECSGEASGSEARGKCEASCKATVQAECDASCEGTPPSASCEAKCQARCEGECRGEANVDCQVSCQSSGYAECQASLQGGCEAQCEKPEGAVFCDGQYVDHGNNAEECIAALNAIISAHVDTSARGSASCSGNSCEAEGEAEASCGARMSPTVPRGSAAMILAGFGLALALGARRRKAL
jgi:hypothetical protein